MSRRSAGALLVYDHILVIVWQKQLLSHFVWWVSLGRLLAGHKQASQVAGVILRVIMILIRMQGFVSRSRPITPFQYQGTADLLENHVAYGRV